MLKINVGCGPIGKENWVNIDYGILAFIHKYHLQPLLRKLLRVVSLFRKNIEKTFSPYLDIKWPDNLMIHNCLKGLPFKDNEIDFIFASHFLEHLKYYEAEFFLKEVLRVLKKGGLVRIVVPDLVLLIKKYTDNDQNFFKKHTYPGIAKDYEGEKTVLRGDCFVSFFFPYHTWKKQPKIIAKIFRTFVRPHLWMYDFESLADLLKKTGFKKIKKWSYRKGKMPDLKILDLHPDESLYVEAEK